MITCVTGSVALPNESNQYPVVLSYVNLSYAIPQLPGPVGVSVRSGSGVFEEDDELELPVWPLITDEAPPMSVLSPSGFADDELAGVDSEGFAAGVEEAAELELPVCPLITSDAPPILVSSLLDDATEALDAEAAVDVLLSVLILPFRKLQNSLFLLPFLTLNE